MMIFTALTLAGFSRPLNWPASPLRGEADNKWCIEMNRCRDREEGALKDKGGLCAEVGVFTVLEGLEYSRSDTTRRSVKEDFTKPCRFENRPERKQLQNRLLVSSHGMGYIRPLY